MDKNQQKGNEMYKNRNEMQLNYFLGYVLQLLSAVKLYCNYL